MAMKRLGLLGLIASIISTISVIICWNVSFQTRDCPKMASDRPPPSKEPAGVGMDLTAFYGTVSISYVDGSIVDVARVKATADYRKAIEHLSLESSQHLHSPYAKLDYALYDKPCELMRSLRKAVGLPASADVGGLSTMIKELRCEAEAFLGASILSVPTLVVTPSLTALYEEDIVDAFEYTGLQLTSIYISHSLVHETSGAYAGYGLGLCPDYRNPSACKAEIREMESEEVLSILYTRQALRVIYTNVKSAYYFGALAVRFYHDWSLGLDARDEEGYWERVSDLIKEGKLKWPGARIPRRVLLLGDSAGDETFRNVLEKSLLEVFQGVPEILGDSSEFAAARGAAELARRSIYAIKEIALGFVDVIELSDKELR
ncbi:hypothetical protein F5884DRAFT_805720 [Xylogone sp. PMI_703]|nr:hypothetical protein F5884DRAFT_805720 [Xylogone sp. PMI_703]